MVEIVPYEPRHLSALVALADAHLALVPPHDARMIAPALEMVVRQYHRLWLHHYPEDADIPTHHRALVALEAGEPVGLAIVRWSSDDESGHVAFLLAEPSMPEAADRLIEEATAMLSAQACATIEAGDRCPIGLGWFGLPTTWTHLIGAYERAGFACVDGWAIMTGRTDAVPIEPPRPAKEMIHVLLTEHPDRREWRIEFFHDEENVGECDAWGVPPHLDSCPGFGDWITIEWIGVAEEFRRRGLAFWLMVKQMHYHLRAGRHYVMLWTGPDNLPARSLYRRLGFDDGPETRVFRKVL